MDQLPGHRTTDHLSEQLTEPPPIDQALGQQPDQFLEHLSTEHQQGHPTEHRPTELQPLDQVLEQQQDKSPERLSTGHQTDRLSDQHLSHPDLAPSRKRLGKTSRMDDSINFQRKKEKNWNQDTSIILAWV